MPDLAGQRCFNHVRREAVARCPVCGRYFCRECVTEHDDRVICAPCLKQLVPEQHKRQIPFRSAGTWSLCLAGLFVAWATFFYIGRVLLLIPAEFHEGKVWTWSWWDAL